MIMSSESTDRTVRILGEGGLEKATQRDLDRLFPDVEKAESTQQQEDPDVSVPEFYDPPKNPEQLLNLLQRSETHQACVEAKSKAVAGHGFTLVPHESVDEDAVTDVPDPIRQFWYEGTFQLGPGAIHATASEVQEHAWNDLEAVGWLAIEILNNPNTFEPTGLAHIPSYQIRKRHDAPGYVELDDGGKIVQYYGEAGGVYGDEQTFVDAETGEHGDSTGDVETVANELIVLRNYSALSPHYGLPDVVPGIKTLAGDIAAREYNRRFFSNDTVPRLAVIVEGGELTDKAWEDLQQTFRDLRDQKNAHRGVLLETTSTVASSLGEEQGANIRIEPLTVGVDEDAGFVTYRDNNEHYLLQAHGVPPVVIGKTEGINFANAKSQRVNFAQTTVKPKQERFAARLYQVLHVTAFEEPDWTIEFTLHGGENRLRNSEITANRIKASQGSLTINEARSELGYEPLDGSEGEVLLATLKKSGGAGGGSAPMPTETTQIRNAVERSRGLARREILRVDTTFAEGDVVEIDGDIGVIVEVHTEDFEAPTPDGETISASTNSPKYLVGMKAGGFEIVTASQMSPASFDESGDPEELKFRTKQDTTFSLPEGWTRATLLDAWASMGGSFTGCVAEMSDEGVDADEFCAAMKDRVLGTELWR